MGCEKNNKSFLFIKYNGEHKYEVTSASVFMKYDDEFVVRYRCSLCGAEYERHFVSWEEMLRLGFSNRRIQEIRSGNNWYETEGSKY